MWPLGDITAGTLRMWQWNAVGLQLHTHKSHCCTLSLSLSLSLTSCSYPVQKRIWSSPYKGQVRLQDGDYPSQGRVEIFCNEKWGTVCGSFGQDEANTVCRQLGYTRSERFRFHLKYVAKRQEKHTSSCSMKIILNKKLNKFYYKNTFSRVR